VAKKAKNPLDVLSGERIREARESRNWSQERLAAESGWKKDKPTPKGSMHPSSVAMYERGERRLPREIADTLSRMFNLPAAYWLGVIDEYEAEVLQAVKKRPRTAAGGR
jgi:transcriptional regulator with XRE-family HTH domain